MSNYAVTGTLGQGKSLLAVDKIKSYLWHGRKVATNLDLKMENLLPSRYGKKAPVRCVRLPDLPTAADLEALGKGADVLDERKYGLIVLDELAMWLNAREWADPKRQALINWLVHSRKHRWDVYFLIQHLEALDKQVRQMLVEYHVKCLRFDKVKLPLLSSLGELVTLGLWDGYLPKIHKASVIYLPGSSPNSPLVTDRWLYRGHELYNAYDTEQAFSEFYPHGMYSYLSPWHLKGRYEKPVPWWRRVFGHSAGEPLRPAASRPGPSPRLEPLMRLPPELRWRAARELVARGFL